MSAIPAKDGEAPQIRLAAEILAAEGVSPGDRASILAAASSVILRLHGSLRPLIGAGGFEAILVRAYMTTCGQWPEFNRARLRPSSEGWAEALDKALHQLGDDVVEEGSHAYVAGFLAALARVLGWPLTRILVRDLWPEGAFSLVPFPDTDNPSKGAVAGTPVGEE